MLGIQWKLQAQANNHNITVQLCQGASKVLKATVSQATDAAGGYIWFRNGVILSTTPPHIDSIIIDTTGYYTVVSINAGGCSSSISEPIIVTSKQLKANDNYNQTSKNNPITINTINSITEGCQPLNPSSITATSTPIHGALVPNENGVFTYVPEDNFVGIDSFTYIAEDYAGTLSNDANIFVTVTDQGQSLPLEWLYFNAKKSDNNHALLNWNINIHNNNTTFFIERSSDLNHFETIGTTSSLASIAEYQFLDTHTLPGKNLYRIKTKDLNGDWLYSTTQIINFSSTENIQIYPNPVSAVAYIKTGNETKALIQLMDINGRVLFTTQPTSNILEIDLSAYPNGTYIIKVTNNNKETSVHKINKI
jgi:hypothetical protein